MNDDTVQDAQSGGMTLSDIYFVLFRQKWKILFFSVVGVAGAIALLILQPPLYQSQTKLFIPYVLYGKSLAPPGNEAATRPLNDQEASIINTEVEILRSFDLARQVAEAVGPERILAKAGAGSNLDQAAELVMKNLIVEPAARGSVIPILFQHPDPEVTREVLTNVVNVYVNKHVDAYQLGNLGDRLTQETMLWSNQLAQTEQQLREAKTNAGVTTTVDEAKKGYADQILKITESLQAAEAELAEHQAALEAIRPAPTASNPTNAGPSIPPLKVAEYRRVSRVLEMRVNQLQEKQLVWKDNSSEVRALQALVDADREQKQKLEDDYPGLKNLDFPVSPLVGPPGTPQPSLATETLLVTRINSRIEKLKKQLSDTQDKLRRVEEMEPDISKLQRGKERVENNLKYFLVNQEQSRIDEELGMGKAPNIRPIDPPTPPVKARPKSFRKRIAIVALGPILGGIALAFMIELFLDRSVRRPGDIESRLGLPVFLSIPAMNLNGKAKAITPAQMTRLLSQRSSQTDGTSDAQVPRPSGLELIRWAAGDSLRPFFCALRDRLIGHFEAVNLTRKPKLVAVAGCAVGSGVSTLAAGLAASLSETGDGNVLLVDMNMTHGAAHYFHKGNLEAGLDTALEHETRSSALVQDNLYVVTEATRDDKVARLLPKRFTQLVPRLRVSDYDYIIFDMPPVSPISLTSKLARFMDMTLLVVESEKTDREMVKHASAMLGGSKSNLGVVLNKKRTYVPQWLLQEY